MTGGYRRHRSKPPAKTSPTWSAVCGRCGKHVFESRKEARRFARKVHPDDCQTAYECTPGVWHYGHSDWREVIDQPPVHEPTPTTALAQIHGLAKRGTTDV